MELLLLLPEIKQGRDRGLCVTGSARPHLCSTHSPPPPPAGWRRGSQAQPPGRAGAVTPREGVAHGDRARTGRPLGCVWAAAVDAGVCVCVCVCPVPPPHAAHLHEGLPQAGLEEGLGLQDQLLPQRWGVGKTGSRPASPLGPLHSHGSLCPHPLPSRQQSWRLEVAGSQRSASRTEPRVGPPTAVSMSLPVRWTGCGGPLGSVCVMFQGCPFQQTFSPGGI